MLPLNYVLLKTNKMKTQDIYAVVTGAGQGLGKAFAIELAKQGKNLILLAKEGEGLEKLSQELSDTFHIQTQFLELNFLDADAIKQIAEFTKNYEIDMLINNAGIGGSMYFEKTDIVRIDSIIQVNIRTMVMLTHLLVDKLKQHTESYILNVASMAACCPIAFKTVYPASKAFVYSFSKSMSEEFKHLGIHVCVLLPGPFKTNKEVSNRINQQGWWVKTGLLTTEKLAKTGIDALFHNKSVAIPGLINKTNWLLLKILPKALAIPMVSHAVKNEIQAVSIGA